MGPARTIPVLALGVLTLCLGGAGFARADHRPVIAIPGNPEVPVIINGVDASYGYVSGEWGLHRPGHGGPLVIVPFYPHFEKPAGGYFPSEGRRPRYGRREVKGGTRGHLESAPSYYRTWSTGPDLRPTIEHPPYDPPPVIRAPDSDN